MWAYRSAQDCEQPVVLFEYQPGRAQEHLQLFLAGYAGMLMTDGYSAWRTVKGVTHYGCAAHARRKFDEAFRAQKSPTGARNRVSNSSRHSMKSRGSRTATCPKARRASTTRIGYVKSTGFVRKGKSSRATDATMHF
jgi:hypothetical protein